MKTSRSFRARARNKARNAPVAEAEPHAKPSAPCVDADTSNGDFVPRLKGQGYAAADIRTRREWIEIKTGNALPLVSSCALSGEDMRGNIENPIGAAQIPIGVAGPLLIKGVHARGVFYVPMATTEGALVRSYERGMVAMTRSGGAQARIHLDENRVSPIFLLADIEEADGFVHFVKENIEHIRDIAESTTSHGKLLRVECYPVGRKVITNFCYFTQDAQGMNMIVKATERACQWIAARSRATHYYLFSGLSSEKRASGFLLPGGKGKKVVAGAHLSPEVVKTYLHTTPQDMLDMWQHTVIGHLQASAIGYCGHLANGLAAIFIACGQDVANIVNAAVGITNLELAEGGGLYASVTLPSLTVATVGGGTGRGTALECLGMLACQGNGKAGKFAEIIAATLLAGEISMGAAIATGEFANAHETYGRNRPVPAPD